MEHWRPRARRRALLLAVVVAVVAGGTPVRAHAVLRFDHHRNGNGHHNRIDLSVKSPTYNRGIQHVVNTNVDGNTVTQASFCKGRFRHCRFDQWSAARSHW